MRREPEGKTAISSASLEPVDSLSPAPSPETWSVFRGIRANDHITITPAAMSEARSHHGHRERREGAHRENRQERTRPSSNNRPATRSQYGARNQSSHSHGRRTTSEERHGSTCTHICSRRGIVLMCAFLCNLLLLFCAVAAYVTLSGMSAMNFGGGSFVDVMIPFEGTELQKVRDLDMQYTQMRAPGLYGSLSFTITFGVISLFFVMSGNKPAHVLPRKVLVGQFVFQLIGAVAYVTAVGLYLHFVIKVNSTDVCLMRERLYARNGQTWMNCSVNGADGAVALFGIIAAILYGVGAFFTARTIRNVHQYNKERAHYEAERSTRQHNTQDSTLQSGIYI